MKISNSLLIRSIVLAAALAFSPGFMPQALAGASLLDLNSKKINDLGDVLVLALNDLGQVAGQSSARPFFTGPDGQGITSFGDYGSDARAINNAGQMVVVHWFDPGHELLPPPRTAITGPNGVGMTDLGSLGGGDSWGWDINSTGQVVGWSATRDGRHHAFITGPNGKGMRDLGTLGGSQSEARGINDVGQVTGISTTAEGTTHSFITGPNGTGMIDLGSLLGDETYASAINDAGQVAGIYRTAEGFRAFITGHNGVGMTDIGTLGGSESYADAINDAGQVVGFSTTAQGAPGCCHAFATGPNGQDIKDLNSVFNLPNAPIFGTAVAINNHGQIITQNVVPTSPIPEPSPYVLMLSGLVLVSFLTLKLSPV